MSNVTSRQYQLRKQHHHRAAFTLLEMLLVLALLLVLVSVVWPAVLRISAGNRLRQSMLDLNSAFAAARVRAIEQGVMYQVFLEPGGQQYLVVPVDQGLLGGESTGNDTVTASASQPVLSGKLPEEFQFSKQTSAVVTEAAVPFAWLSNQPNSKDWNWMQGAFPITFYPDGTAAFDLNQDVLKAERPVARVQLRGLTGTATVSYVLGKSS
ncbi:hypothetical protein Pan153_54150 [Gimesia panareensis]|uniref:General secretion pathway GspH domain-containing protein n=1 Tax=Gimesia panareensis TaxID=2527978 RepID=A0A518FWI1_9PLAN|nr:prepilin-type N-terminal cleavage/methylation domain-containing protein [Gimesia panareensis]QDV20737.1 hypothetical protein Pan153_54150 [Gimesia panareensis]